VYGTEIASDLLPIGSESEGPIEIGGLVGSPAVSRANRNYISLFVNRRWIRNRSLTYAVVEAYQGMLPLGRFPVAIIDIHVPPDAVDVNVHPTKAEVRFREERAVFAVLQRAVRRTLASRASVPEFAPSSSFFEAQHAEVQQRALSWREQASSRRMLPPPPPASTPASSMRTQREPDQLSMADSLPLLRPVGQLGNTYVVAEGPDGMYMIDQHAAHERVLYERLLAQQSTPGGSDVQPLLQPQPLDLTARQRTLLEAFREELGASGLTIEPFGDGTYLVRTVPPALAGKDVVRAVGELLDLLGRDDGPVDDPKHRVAASLACHASVRAGQTMTDEEQRELLRLLEQSEHARTCPHGRPTMIHLSSDALAKQFRRR
jgi:DNA mismatch repair protein MutL